LLTKGIVWVRPLPRRRPRLSLRWVWQFPRLSQYFMKHYFILFQLVKRNMIENVVPIVIAAKHLFEREHHPLLKDLLACLKELMQVREEPGRRLRRFYVSFRFAVPLLSCLSGWRFVEGGRDTTPAFVKDFLLPESSPAFLGNSLIILTITLVIFDAVKFVMYCCGWGFLLFFCYCFFVVVVVVFPCLF